MIKTILIANRGEIACRIIKTATQMGIKTVAIYSEVDAHMLHVEMADEAYCVGSAPAAQSYLSIERIIEVARVAKVCAIHPGYGFLSEDARFAKACEQAGIIFIGPSAEAMAAMGSKSQAKQLMRQHQIPLTPGYDGDHQQVDYLVQQALKIGFPLLIKASSGGGGKGMRLVRQASELLESIDSAKREAKASFGDEQLLLEKYLEKARHVEVQIFCDQHGHGVYLYDRDCSIQRRHQKIIEEAPAPHLSQSLRQKMGEVALKAAQAVHYAGAGTVEFLLAEDQVFYFMEMNTRLQVEHPVTEMVTGIDLVAWQILVANHQVLPMTQEQIPCHGHALEVRLCAEDPMRQFIPSSGHLAFLALPEQKLPYVRVDSGIRKGDEISPYYDSMLAKIIAYGESRVLAIQQLIQALEQTAMLGVESNAGLLLAILNEEDFRKARLNTDYLKEHHTLLSNHHCPADASIMAALVALDAVKKQAKQQAFTAIDATSPWSLGDGFRIADTHYDFSFRLNDQVMAVRLVPNEGDQYQVSINYEIEQTVCLRSFEDHKLQVLINGRAIRAIGVNQHDQLAVFLNGLRYDFYPLPRHEALESDHTSHQDLVAPMHSSLLKVLVEPGQRVRSGEPLLILEAMKMEHHVHAPFEGLVQNIYFQPGDTLQEGVELLELIPC